MVINQALPSVRNLLARQHRPLTPSWLITSFILAFLLIASRRPSDFLHWQFYAEDGQLWYAQAYNLGFAHALLIPDASYLQILPRLAAGAALLIPFHLAPLLFNGIGAALQALPVPVLLSSRCAPWGSLGIRLAFSVVYVAHPNAREVHVNITNAQWHLGLLTALLAFGAPANAWFWKAADCAIFLLASLSGPFGIVLTPLILLYWWRTRQNWSLVQGSCLIPGVLWQTYLILTGTRAMKIPLGASFDLLLKIIGQDIFIDGLLGATSISHIPVMLFWAIFVLSVTVLFLGFRRAPFSFHLYGIYSLLLLAGALKRPMITGPLPLWYDLLQDGSGRYWFFPTLCLLWAAVYASHPALSGFKRYAGPAALMLFVLGAVRVWEYPKFNDFRFPIYSRQFEGAGHGTRENIPIYPAGWTMVLVKR